MAGEITKTLGEVPIVVHVELGTTMMPISQLLKLGRGAVITLNTKVGETLDIYANKKPFAKGEIEVLENRIGVSITEIL